MRITRWIIATMMAVGGASVSLAEEPGLHALHTMDAMRGWEAVGKLNLDGVGFCTGALIAQDLVLTAAHCLYDKRTGERIDHTNIEFLAGWRNGRASAYRNVRRAVVHPDFVFDAAFSTERVRNDLALIELDQPIRNTTVTPFKTSTDSDRGDEVGIVSYARGRSEAPSLEEICDVMARQEGVLVMSCSVDFGSSGAPIFRLVGGKPQVVSVVSAKAELDGQRVALGTALGGRLSDLKALLSAGGGYDIDPAPQTTRIRVGQVRRDTGAKFVRP